MTQEGLPKFAIEGIAVDALFYSRAIRSVAEHPKSSLLVVGFVPLVALFIVESHDRLKETFTNLRVEPSDVLALLRPIRHRTKLLLSDKSSVDEVVDEFHSIAAAEKAHFFAGHTGVLAPFKRLLQPDLGLTRVDGHIFSTTHATRFWLGGKTHDGAYHQRLGWCCTSYLEAFLREFAPRHPPITAFEPPTLGRIDMADIRSHRLYSRSSLGTVEKRWAAVATMLLANLNFANRVVSAFGPPDHPTLLKLRTLTAYNTVHSLILMQQRLWKSNLPPPAAQVLSAALSSTEARWLRKQRDLRNLLTHFTPQHVAPSQMNLSLEQAISLYAGCDMEELAARMSILHQHLERTLAGGFALQPETFSMGIVS